MIKIIVFIISLIALIVSLYKVFIIGWGTDPRFIIWSLIGGISLIIAIITSPLKWFL